MGVTILPLEDVAARPEVHEMNCPFTGDKALREQKERGVVRRSVGFKLLGRGIARPGYPVWIGGKQVDVVRSGGQSPSLGIPIGTTMLPAGSTAPGTLFEVECRGERIPAEVVRKPFWTQGSVKKA